MTTEKTPLEWYQHLPEPYRMEAVENWLGCEDLFKGHPVESLCEAIAIFIWDEIPQPLSYWSDIYARSYFGEFDKVPPKLHGWIPVGERLPEESDGDENGDVMVLDKNKLKSICKPKWVKINIDLIQFWQPLPKLPEVQS